MLVIVSKLLVVPVDLELAIGILVVGLVDAEATLVESAHLLRVQGL